MFTTQLNDMLSWLNAHEVQSWKDAAVRQNVEIGTFDDFVQEYVVEQARKYTKIYRKSSSSMQIVMFIDKDGNIYKPASCKAPAKGIRGHITDWRKSLTVYPQSGVVCVNYNR